MINSIGSAHKLLNCKRLVVDGAVENESLQTLDHGVSLFAEQNSLDGLEIHRFCISSIVLVAADYTLLIRWTNFIQLIYNKYFTYFWQLFSN